MNGLFFREQLELKQMLLTHDDFDPASIQYIGGTDLSFSKTDPNLAIASFVVLSFPDLKVSYK